MRGFWGVGRGFGKGRSEGRKVVFNYRRVRIGFFILLEMGDSFSW